jgi:uncharacterized membrane protein YfcA
VDGDVFVKILGVVTIVLSLLMFIPVKTGEGANPVKSKLLLYPLLFAIGFYGGFIQAGTGIFIMFVLRSFLKLDLVKVNVHKVFIAFIFTIPAFLSLFIMVKSIGSPDLCWELAPFLVPGSQRKCFQNMVKKLLKLSCLFQVFLSH